MNIRDQLIEQMKENTQVLETITCGNKVICGNIRVGSTITLEAENNTHYTISECNKKDIFIVGEIVPLDILISSNEPNFKIDDAKYLLYNDQITLYGDLKIESNNLYFMFNCDKEGVFTIEYLIRIGQQIIITRKKVEVLA